MSSNNTENEGTVANVASLSEMSENERNAANTRKSCISSNIGSVAPTRNMAVSLMPPSMTPNMLRSGTRKKTAEAATLAVTVNAFHSGRGTCQPAIRISCNRINSETGTPNSVITPSINMNLVGNTNCAAANATSVTSVAAP